MKKALPYLLIGLLVVAVVFLLLNTKNIDNHHFDERMTFRVKDKIPYGMYVAFKGLKHIFPVADISINRNEPGYWDSLSNYTGGQALIIVNPQFQATEYEMKRLIAFMEKGNDVFISARYLSEDAKTVLGCKINARFEITNPLDPGGDSLTLQLSNPPFGINDMMTYQGNKYDAYFYDIDTTTTEIIGTDGKGQANFVHLRVGMGNMYVHLAPLAFSNYFLLHGNNIRYYNNAFSVVNPRAKKIVWDEYYLYKRANRNDNKRPSWLSVLFRYPALKAALLTALFTLLVYVLLEMRRKQRYIPVINRPKNESLDFVRTIGRLYHDKGDHRNLGRKMGAYFLEHVRSRYKMLTGNLDDTFVKNLQFKTGVEEAEIRGIISFIKYLDDAPAISQSELINFHKQLELFYKRA